MRGLGASRTGGGPILLETSAVVGKKIKKKNKDGQRIGASRKNRLSGLGSCRFHRLETREPDKTTVARGEAVAEAKGTMPRPCQKRHCARPPGRHNYGRAAHRCRRNHRNSLALKSFSYFNCGPSAEPMLTWGRFVITVLFFSLCFLFLVTARSFYPAV